MSNGPIRLPVAAMRKEQAVVEIPANAQHGDFNRKAETILGLEKKISFVDAWILMLATAQILCGFFGIIDYLDQGREIMPKLSLIFLEKISGRAYHLGFLEYILELILGLALQGILLYKSNGGGTKYPISLLTWKVVTCSLCVMAFIYPFIHQAFMDPESSNVEFNHVPGDKGRVVSLMIAGVIHFLQIKCIDLSMTYQEGWDFLMRVAPTRAV